MRLLVVTQKVDKNDPILGFFHRWLEEFAKRFEKVTIICLFEGEHSLPGNVKVLSLGKEKGYSKVRYIVQFYKYIWQERKNYDYVFVHMNPEYMALAGLLWRILHKKAALWYVHRQANFKLWLAEKFARVIFTSAPESFRLKSNKVKYLNHGVDTDLFQFSSRDFSESTTLLHVGRITRIKNIDVIIRATDKFPLHLLGEPVTSDDKIYQKTLKELSDKLNVKITWLGSVPNFEMPQVYSKYFASINAAPDGGMDKVVLESLAAGCPVFLSNRAFKSLLGEFADVFIFKFSDSDDLSRKLYFWQQNKDKKNIMEKLSNKVRAEYAVSTVISKILINLDA